jgi:hypothetical protein
MGAVASTTRSKRHLSISSHPRGTIQVCRFGGDATADGVGRS